MPEHRNRNVADRECAVSVASAEIPLNIHVKTPPRQEPEQAGQIRPSPYAF